MSRNQARNLGVLFLAAIVFHGVLIPYTMGQTYDAYIHMFFGDHYNRSWFDPWEPRWYTGFGTTSYPPATHMIIAIFYHFIPLKAAFSTTMLIGLMTLILGFYRFARIWVSEEATFYAALFLVFGSSIVETIHIFGQLPTIFSLGIFLNAMPYIFRWLVTGRWRSLLGAVIISAGATSAHHVTTIFGSVFFIGPLAAYAWLVYINRYHPFANTNIYKGSWRALYPVFRGGILACLILSAVIITVYPYWHWSFTDPINQVPIPHGTRESFIERPDLGFVFFFLPWGMTLLLLPYILYKGFTTKLWPFAGSLLLCLILGTGGTTPLSRMILHGAFDILTLDRFTFWGSILALPFVGMLIHSLVAGQKGQILSTWVTRRGRTLVITYIIVGYAGIASFIAVMGALKSLQPKPIDPAPIVQFMESDQHDRWRYLTLGFGDQFAYISAKTSALSVDGNYHSARRLPAFTNYSVERLENAKYLGIGGLGSLQQFLTNANEYHLKYVFSNDNFYGPLLYASGWNDVVRLPNNIVIWEKPNIDPLPFTIPRKNFPTLHRLMWGIVPPTMCLLAFFVIGSSAYRLIFKRDHDRPIETEPGPLKQRIDLVIFLLSLSMMTIVVGSYYLYLERSHHQISSTPKAIVERYFLHLNLRQFQEAYALLDPITRTDYPEWLFARMWDGGIINSYGDLRHIYAHEIKSEGAIKDFRVEAEWLTALGMMGEDREMRTIKRDNTWYIAPRTLPAHQSSERLLTRNQANFHSVGRRQPREETELHKDKPDRPELAIGEARVVKYKDMYSLIGMVTNTDADPFYLALQGFLADEEHEKLVTSNASVSSPFRLLPAESSGFRLNFEARLSIQDAQQYEGFDPDTFLPPELEAEPKHAYMGASTVITDTGLYRNVMIAEIETQTKGDEVIISGRVVNNGIDTLTTSKIITTLYDQTGELKWVDSGFVNEVLRPGQTGSFRVIVPKADDIEILYKLGSEHLELNLNLTNLEESLPRFNEGTVPINSETGYGYLRLYIDPQVHKDVF